jgi:hypothetical protein
MVLAAPSGVVRPAQLALIPPHPTPHPASSPAGYCDDVYGTCEPTAQQSCLLLSSRLLSLLLLRLLLLPLLPTGRSYPGWLLWLPALQQQVKQQVDSKCLQRKC